MKAQRINTRPGQVLEIVAHRDLSPYALDEIDASADLFGRLLGLQIIVRAADTTGWRGRWVDGRPR